MESPDFSLGKIIHTMDYVLNPNMARVSEKLSSVTLPLCRTTEKSRCDQDRLCLCNWVRGHAKRAGQLGNTRKGKKTSSIQKLSSPYNSKRSWGRVSPCIWSCPLVRQMQSQDRLSPSPLPVATVSLSHTFLPAGLFLWSITSLYCTISVRVASSLHSKCLNTSWWCGDLGITQWNTDWRKHRHLPHDTNGDPFFCSSPVIHSLNQNLVQPYNTSMYGIKKKRESLN